jgi:hypothetical protein
VCSVLESCLKIKKSSNFKNHASFFVRYHVFVSLDMLLVRE